MDFSFIQTWREKDLCNLLIIHDEKLKKWRLDDAMLRSMVRLGLPLKPLETVYRSKLSLVVSGQWINPSARASWWVSLHNL